MLSAGCRRTVLAKEEFFKVGNFTTYAAVYVGLAFIFQAGALLFAGVDGSCRSNRFLWLLLILLTGPVGLLIYFIWGRHRFARKP